MKSDLLQDLRRKGNEGQRAGCDCCNSAMNLVPSNLNVGSVVYVIVVSVEMTPTRL